MYGTYEELIKEKKENSVSYGIKGKNIFNNLG